MINKEIKLSDNRSSIGIDHDGTNVILLISTVSGQNLEFRIPPKMSLDLAEQIFLNASMLLSQKKPMRKEAKPKEEPEKNDFDSFLNEVNGAIKDAVKNVPRAK